MMMSEEATKTAQILVRISEEEREEWKEAAEKMNVSMSDLIREAVAPIVNAALHCTHPQESRTSYPWSEFCNLCEERLRG